jgi:Tripartite tricarboxylate transporter family receptor
MKSSLRQTATPQHRSRPRGNDRPHPKTPSSDQHPRRRFLGLAAGAAALPAMSRVAWAQVYPSRPVRLIVGFAAGGSADIVARLIGQWLSDKLRQSFLIDNRPGASGNIGAEAVVRARADGYTLLVATSTDAINATLYDKLNFNFISDIAPVARIGYAPLVMVVHPSIPAKTVPELIAYSKANPGKLNMGSPGNGTAPHVAGEMFKMVAGINMVQVQYRGSAPAIADLLGGQVEKRNMSLWHSDQTLPIFRRANAGAMSFANVRPTRRRKAGRVPRKSSNLMKLRRPSARRRRQPPSAMRIVYPITWLRASSA